MEAALLTHALQSDGYLNLAEFNALQQFLGEPPITQEQLTNTCWSDMSDFYPEIDAGIDAPTMAKLSVRGLMQNWEKEVAHLAKLGFQINDAARPTQRECDGMVRMH